LVFMSSMGARGGKARLVLDARCRRDTFEVYFKSVISGSDSSL